MHHFVGLRSPLLGACHVHPESFRDELLRAFIGEKFEIGKGSLASELSVIITEFVLQDSAKPAADGRLAGKPVAGPHRSQKRVLDQVLSDFRSPHTRQRVAI